MTLRCPKCRTPSLLRASELGPVGRLERCGNCETTWLARKSAGNAFQSDNFRPHRPVTRKPPRIIEGDAVPKARYTTPPPGSLRFGTGSPSRARTGTGRYAAAALVLMLIAVVLLTPAVSALPQLSAVFFKDDSMALQSVKSRTVTLRGTAAILVEGEIINQSNRERDVPAVRIALTEDGAEVYTWLLEPTVFRLGAGGKVGFRSAMASPRSSASQISLSLAGREEAR